MRKTDRDAKTHFRSGDRVFQMNDSWWFATREGDQGPFESRQEARDALAQFMLDVRGDIELNDVSILERTPAENASAWDIRPDVIR